MLRLIAYTRSRDTKGPCYQAEPVTEFLVSVVALLTLWLSVFQSLNPFYKHDFPENELVSAQSKTAPKE